MTISKEMIRYAGGAELMPARAVQRAPDELDLRSLWGALWRRKLLLIGTVAIITGAAVAYVQTAMPLYRGQALVRIQPGKAMVVDLPDVNERFEANGANIESEVELLRSRAFAERMVDKLGLAGNPEFNVALRPEPQGLVADARRRVDALVAQLRSHLPGAVAAVEPAQPADPATTLSRVVDRFEAGLSVEQVSKSYVLDIRFTSEDPVTAAGVANAVADAYIQGQLDEKQAATERAKLWLQQRVQEMRERVVASERQLVGLQADKGIVSGDRVDPLAQQLGQLNAQLAEARAARAEAEARYNQIAGIVRSKAGGGAAAKVMNSPLIADLRAQEAAVQSQLSELRTQFGAKHPQILTAEAQLRSVRARIMDEADRVVRDLGNEVAVARARERELQASLAAVQSQVQGQDRSSVELRDFEREATSARQIYESFLNRLREVTEAHDLQQADATLLSAAQVPLEPAAPNKLLIVIVAFGAASMLGVILVFAVEQWGTGHGLRSADEIQSGLGMRALSLLPMLGRRELHGQRAEDYVLRKPHSAFAEAVQRIRTSLFLGGGDRPVRTVLVTSSVPGEGKSLLCAALARQSARAGLRTLLIDADMRRARQHDNFRCDNRGGLGDVLAGTVPLDEAIVTDEASGMRLLVAGTPSVSPADAFRSAAMRRLLDEAARDYDLVVLDSPPVGAVSDSFILGGLVDQTVFVARWQSTPRNMILHSLKQLGEAGADIAGVVLSQVDVKKHARYGYADSGYYAGAYRKYYVN